MTSFLRVVAVAAGLGSWVLLAVGAGIGQSLHAPVVARAAGTATGVPRAALPAPAPGPVPVHASSAAGPESRPSDADRPKSEQPAHLDLKN